MTIADSEIEVKEFLKNHPSYPIIAEAMIWGVLLGRVQYGKTREIKEAAERQLGERVKRSLNR